MSMWDMNLSLFVRYYNKSLPSIYPKFRPQSNASCKVHNQDKKPIAVCLFLGYCRSKIFFYKIFNHHNGFLKYKIFVKILRTLPKEVFSMMDQLGVNSFGIIMQMEAWCQQQQICLELLRKGKSKEQSVIHFADFYKRNIEKLMEHGYKNINIFPKIDYTNYLQYE